MKKLNIKLIHLFIKIFLNLLWSLLFPVVVISVEKSTESIKSEQTSLLLAQVEANTQRQAEADKLFDDGLKLYERSQFQEALIIFQKALVICRKITDKKCESFTLNVIGLTYQSLGDYQKALDNYQDSLVITRQRNDNFLEGIVLNNVGMTYTSNGQYQNALQSYTKALEIVQKYYDNTKESNVLRSKVFNNLGSLYWKQGRYQQALDSYQKVLPIFQELGKDKNVATTFNNIGTVFISLGQYQQALENFKKVLPIVQKIGDKQGEGRVISNIGEVYRNLRRNQEAIENFKKALVIAQEIGDKAGESTRLNNIGSSYLNLKQYQQALNAYQQALIILKKVDNKEFQGRTLNNIGVIYRILEKYEEALNNYKEALAIGKQVGDKFSESLSLTNIGELYIFQEKYIDSEKYLFEAIEIMDSLRNRLKDDQKISLFEQQADTYSLLQQSYIGQNKVEQALETSERGRARSLIDLLSSKSATNNVTVNLPTIVKLKKIAQQQKATFVEYSVINEFFKSGNKDELLSEKLYIWVVKPTGEIIFQQVDLKSTKIPLKQLVANSRQSIGVGGRGIQPVPKVGVNQQQKLQQLHQILIQPIAKHLPKNPDERVIFIPHEALFLVPFPALKDVDGKYLIEKHTILTAPTIQLLDYTRRNPERLNLTSLRSEDVLLVGNPTMPFVGIPPKQLSPLPGAEKEARTIGQLLNTQPLIGKQATKSVVLQKLQNAKVIHFATHGLLDGFGDRIPGAIVLSADSPPSPQQTNEGLLKATEIIDLKLKADLVVLSACDTGRGEITGDGVVGLSRSLLGAGVSSIIVSLWALDDDSTSELMQDFYKELQRNPDKAKALRQAMLKTMQKHPSPAYWSAFTIIGNAE